jgi:predicted RNase H-like nuclease (RuvC/YqgF family)
MNTWTCSVSRDDKRADRSAASVVQKIALTAIVAQGDNSNQSGLLRGPMAKPPRDRRTLPSRQRTYTRLRAQVDRLEDAISHFYSVINELRRRVSALEKKSKPLAKR